MKTKQKILLGLAGLTALAVAGGSVGTMAWFYSNTTVTASGLSMSVATPPAGLEISTDGGTTWSTSATFTSAPATLSPCVLGVFEKNGTYPSFRIDSGSSYIGSAQSWEYGSVHAYIPSSANPVSSNGSLGHSWDWQLSASDIASYFTEVATTDAAGYVVSRSFKVRKTTSSTDTFNTTVKVTFSGDTTANIMNALRVYIPPVSDAVLGTNVASLGGASNNVYTISGNVPVSKTGTTFEVYAYFTGDSPYCITDNAISTKSVSFSISVTEN